MPSTWIADPVIENILYSTFCKVDADFSTHFEANSLSNEERLTGAFIKTLIDRFMPVNNLLGNLRTCTTPWYFKLYYNDTTVRRGEKKWCADMAFVLDAKVPGKYECRKAILLQAKKMNSRQTRSGIVFENYWRIDVPQATKLLSRTKSSYYILYNPNNTGLGVRILPANSLVSLATASGNSTTLDTSEATPSTRRLAEFMLYDFIGCWTGDTGSRILRVAEGKDPKRVPNYVIKVMITAEHSNIERDWKQE
jgi:hypothetical protein